MNSTLRRAATGALTLAALAWAAVAGAQGFHAVTSKDGTDFWTVGDAGQVWRSFDGGATHTSTTLGATALRGVAHRGFVVLVVGDGGKVYRSANNGGTFSNVTLGGGAALRAVSFPAADAAYAVGDGGAIWKSVDGGTTWSAQTSGTAAKLNAVHFTDGSNGWAAGAAGTLLRTTDGGANWAPAAGFSSPVELFAVSQNGSSVWVGGADAAAYRSTDGGSTFSWVNLKVDARPEVRGIATPAPGTVWLVGGGGFIRKSTDGGATWTWPTHELHGQASSIAVAGTRLVVPTSKSRALVRSANDGASWSMPTGMTLTRSWSNVRALGGFRGATWQINWYNPDILYVWAGSTIYQSSDRGESWRTIASVSSPGVSTANAFLVSDKDTNVFVGAVDFTGGGRGIVRSENRGGTWATQLSHSFGTYGIPLEKHPDKPDTMVFGGDNDKLYTSYDAGKTWAPYGNKVFRSPCDLIIVPDSSGVWQVGDGITGSGIGDHWQSTDAGVNFTMRQLANGSEIPGMSIARARNNHSIGTTWSAAGARNTSDFGTSWPTIGALGGYTSSWGTDIARDDPYVQLIGQYSGGSVRLSLDGGNTFIASSLTGTNYSFMAVDRGNLFAQMAAALYKMRFNYAYTPSSTQALAVTAPNGGESWQAGTSHNVTWNATNVGLARIEYRRSAGDPWQLVAEVEGYLGSYAWSVPDDPTTTAEVRVSDAWDASPVDVSNATFTILAPRAVVTPGALAFGTHDVGTATTLEVTLQSTGTSTLDVTAVTTASAEFTEGRAAFSLGAGTSDTIGVTFRPTAAVVSVDTLVITTSAGTLRVPLSGTGNQPGSLSLTSPNGGQSWKYGTTHDVTWSAAGIDSVGLDYRTSPAGGWVQIVRSVPASVGTYAWVIPNAPTSTAAVRVRDLGGSFTDLSADTFAITVPAFAGSPLVLDLGNVEVSTGGAGTFTIDNAGTAFLGVLTASSDNPAFVVGRAAFNVNAGASDTLSVTFSPVGVGADSATITFATDDPATPHTLRVRGNAVNNVGVEDGRPMAFGLWQNSPNPFTGRTQIRYALPSRARVSLEVFDLQGHRIASLVEGEQDAGTYTVSFGGRGARPVAAGVYFYRLRAPGFTATKRMLVMP